MSESKEQLLAELKGILSKPVDEILDGQINQSFSNAAESRLSPERRATLKQRVEKDFAMIQAFAEESAPHLARKVLRALLDTCRGTEYAAPGKKGSGETDGLSQYLVLIEPVLNDLEELEKDAT